MSGKISLNFVLGNADIFAEQRSDMKKILYVDHERDLHAKVQEMFPKDKFKVVCAVDGIEGLNKFRNEDFDLVIADYEIKKVEVIKFYNELKELRSDKKAEMVPVIFIGIPEVVEFNQKLFSKFDVVSRPIESEVLLSKVESFFQKPVKPTKVILETGQVLFFEGDEGDNMYYVVEGRLGTFKSQAQVGIIDRGELVGEMSFINKERRSLTVKALEKTELVVIPGDKILSIVKDQPKWIQVMIENLSRRLKETIKQIP